jgi:hypothetical protein
VLRSRHKIRLPIDVAADALELAKRSRISSNMRGFSIRQREPGGCAEHVSIARNYNRASQYGFLIARLTVSEA